MNCRQIIWLQVFLFLSIPMAHGGGLLLGKSYEAVPIPNYHLTKDKGDATQLTDGLYTTGHFWRSSSTVGWQGYGVIKVKVDIGQTAKVGSVCFRSAKGSRSGVSLPNRFALFGSTDGKVFGYFGSAIPQNTAGTEDYKVQKTCLDSVDGRMRYLWLFVEPGSNYTFIDEIDVSPSTAATEKPAAAMMDLKDVATYFTSIIEQERAGKSHEMAALDALKTLTAPTVAEAKVTAVPANLSAEQLRLDALKSSFAGKTVAWKGNAWAPFSSLAVPASNNQPISSVEADLMVDGTESDAVNVTNSSSLSKKLIVKLVPSTGSHSGPTVSIFEATPVLTRSQTWVADPLVPLAGNMELKPGESKQIWLSFSAAGVQPGQYETSLEIKEIGTSSTIQIPVKTKVWDTRLPQERDFSVVNWAYINDRLLKGRESTVMQDLIDHHVNVFVVHPAQRPRLTMSKTGAKLDFAEHDRAISYFKGNGVILFFMNMNDPTYRLPEAQAPFLSPKWKESFRTYIAAWLGRLKSMGLGYSDFAYYPYDEARDVAGAQTLLEVATIIKQVDPNIRVFTTFLSAPTDMIYKLAQVVDIFQLLDGDAGGATWSLLRALGKDVRSYYASGSKMAHPLASYRNQAWRAFRSDARGIGFWSYSDIGAVGTAWNDFDGARPDFAVIYSDHTADGIVPSKRWEAWRHGVEDYYLLRMARAKAVNAQEQDLINKRTDAVIATPADITVLKNARKWLMEIASRP